MGYLTKPDSCVIVLCMLVRKQILLEERQVLELEMLAEMAGISVSKLIREALPVGMKVEKKKAVKRKSKRKNGLEFLGWLANHPVHGPGNSEYDKYAYDWEYDKELREKSK